MQHFFRRLPRQKLNLEQEGSPLLFPTQRCSSVLAPPSAKPLMPTKCPSSSYVTPRSRSPFLSRPSVRPLARGHHSSDKKRCRKNRATNRLDPLNTRGGGMHVPSGPASIAAWTRQPHRFVRGAQSNRDVLCMYMYKTVNCVL